MRGIQPADASAPAETGDQQTMGIAPVARRPAGDVVEIRQHLRVRHLGNQRFEQGRDIVVLIRIALTEVQFMRDSQIAFLRQASIRCQPSLADSS